jgi:dual specificity tyrosine-phosphorylation-regulated kinase 2/3/4
VFKVFDHKKKEMVALKVIKNKKRYYNQAQSRDQDFAGDPRERHRRTLSNIVKIRDFLRFRSHMVPYS